MPLEFFMLRTTHRLFFSVLPVISMRPTFTLGPSLTTNETFRDEGGICSICGSTVAYCRPRSARNSLSTTAARWTLLGSYCDSTVAYCRPRSARNSLRDRKSTRLNSSHSLADAVPISALRQKFLEHHGGPLDLVGVVLRFPRGVLPAALRQKFLERSEEHTSELQSLPRRRCSDLRAPPEIP